MKMTINLREFIFALSDALDFVGVDDAFHGKRVGYMASLCAKEMGYDPILVSDIIEMGLLHDCGVSNTGIHERLVTEFHWEGSQEHCLRGEKLLSSSTILTKYSQVIRYHHTKWEELQSIDIDDDTKLLTNLIFMTDRVDALNAKYASLDVNHRLKTIQEEMIQKTDFFAKDLLDVFVKVSTNQAFWYGLDSTAIIEYLEDWKNSGTKEIFYFLNIKELVSIFAQIVDYKSKFTAEHSLGVALVAKELAMQMGFSIDTIHMIELAGYLHDLGKLRVPDSILDKPSKLDENELSIINRHSFDTNYILKKIGGFEEIAHWSGMHHEKLNGHGYPYGYDDIIIPTEARIITVADIFQALVQNRPYRGTLPKEKVISIVEDMANKGEIDKDIVRFISSKLDHYYDLALNPHNYV